MYEALLESSEAVESSIIFFICLQCKMAELYSLEAAYKASPSSTSHYSLFNFKLNSQALKAILGLLESYLIIETYVKLWKNKNAIWACRRISKLYLEEQHKTIYHFVIFIVSSILARFLWS